MKSVPARRSRRPERQFSANSRLVAAWHPNDRTEVILPVAENHNEIHPTGPLPTRCCVFCEWYQVTALLAADLRSGRESLNYCPLVPKAYQSKVSGLCPSGEGNA